jgi:hypothetical protein
MAFIVKRDAPPAGIPVESTNTIVVNDIVNGQFTLEKVSSNPFYGTYYSASAGFTSSTLSCEDYDYNNLDENGNPTLGTIYAVHDTVNLFFENGTWYYRYSYFNICMAGLLDVASVPQANDGYIPIDGWSPSLTIYAA